MFAAVQTAYHQACHDEAVAQIRARFPWATRAVFTRSWTDPEDQLSLDQLIGGDQVLELDMFPYPAELPAEQVQALQTARARVCELGSEVTAYLDLPDDEHDGWYEYDLDLTAAPGQRDPFAAVLDQLSVTDRANLDGALSERDGRMASMVDTTEIAYQITEGHLQETDPDLAEALIATHGTAQAAAEAIADSDAWFAFREEVADDLHERVKDAIAQAGAATLREDA